MQHEQADKTVPLRLLGLLSALLLLLAVPLLIEWYERRQAFQWEIMVQPHWETLPAPLLLPSVEPDTLAAQDVVEWESLEPEPELVPEPEPVPEPAPEPVASVQPPAPVKPPPVTRKPVPARAAAVKKDSLKLKLPEDPYRGQPAEWEEKPVVVLPDLFAAKPAAPSRLELGGRLITDDEVEKNNPEADFIDTVKGAEINITIKTR